MFYELFVIAVIAVIFLFFVEFTSVSRPDITQPHFSIAGLNNSNDAW